MVGSWWGKKRALTGMHIDITHTDYSRRPAHASQDCFIAPRYSVFSHKQREGEKPLREQLKSWIMWQRWTDAKDSDIMSCLLFKRTNDWLTNYTFSISNKSLHSVFTWYDGLCHCLLPCVLLLLVPPACYILSHSNCGSASVVSFAYRTLYITSLLLS